MARLFGYIGNRADLGAKVLQVENRALRVLAKETTLGWGVGFYQAGEVLLRRRPIDERTEIDVASLAKDLRSDVLLGHVRAATMGKLRTENTHPFRYRQWLFAHTGTVEGYPRARARLVEALPEFLRRDVRGDTDSEILFHIFLSFLHTGGHLIDRPLEPSVTKDAIRSTLSLLQKVCDEEGAQGGMNLLVTDGEHMLGVHGNATMAVRELNGRDDLQKALGDETVRRIRIPNLAFCHFSLVASDFEDAEPAGWTVVPPRAMVLLTRTDEPAIEPL